ncbi:MAG: hypothetical protein ACFFC7_21080 [Candidatus Hermodarchaeota archaeon]
MTEKKQKEEEQSQLVINTPWGSFITVKGIEGVFKVLADDLDKIGKTLQQISKRTKRVHDRVYSDELTIRTLKEETREFQTQMHSDFPPSKDIELGRRINELEKEIDFVSKKLSDFTETVKMTFRLVMSRLDEIEKKQEKD